MRPRTGEQITVVYDIRWRVFRFGEKGRISRYERIHRGQGQIGVERLSSEKLGGEYPGSAEQFDCISQQVSFIKRTALRPLRRSPGSVLLAFFLSFSFGGYRPTSPASIRSAAPAPSIERAVPGFLAPMPEPPV